jgi:cytochrome c oxidase cbb3-type subunit 3
MSAGWSWYVNLLVILNIAGCTLLLWWTARRRKGVVERDSTGHVWDGDIAEFDKPLPRWWINLFYLTILFSVGYLIWFPGMGSFGGVGGWTSRAQHEADKAAGDARLAETFRPYDDKPIEALAADPAAVALGQAIFSNHCATCHGSFGQGAIGYPDLTDDNWQWGGGADEILQTVLGGRKAVMPGWSQALLAAGGETAVEDVISYTLSLTDPALSATNEASVARGRGLFASVCAACHGIEARGNPQLGAPDLTDDYWLYGRSRAILREGIELGRNGAMPAQQELIGATRARLAAAYAWTLSQD